MATLDSLPGDQRAVLQLVLQRGRTYDQIAALLSIDRAAVRQRALAAFDALGPQTGVEAQRRALIADYLLGQLPASVSEETRERLAESPSERAWARVVASELTSIAAEPLPEIPVESTRRDALPDAEPARRRRPLPKPAPEAAGVASGASGVSATPDEHSPPGGGGARQPKISAGQRPSSRLGGALLLGGALIVIIVAIVLIAGGGSSKKRTTTTAAKAPTSTAAATTGTTATTTPQVIRQINLISPTAPKTGGLADVLKQGTSDGIAIIAQNVPANTKHDAYAVWLFNSPADNHILGFVNPGVGTNGRLSTAGPLPANASHYKALIVTLETQANPKAPGKIILEGSFSL